METVAEKIRKLLALSESSNEHEAALALQHAMRLMEKHQISMAQVKATERGRMVRQDVDTYVSVAFHERLAGRIVRDFFHVSAVFNANGGHDSGVCDIAFFGRAQDVEIATYVYDFLARLFFRLSKESGLPKRQWPDFQQGLHDGLAMKLREEQLTQAGENPGNLPMVVEEKALRQALMREHFPYLSKGGGNVGNADSAAGSIGFSRGQQINIRQAVRPGGAAKQLN